MMEQSIALDMKQLLHDLQPEQPINAREGAVAQLAGLSVSNLQLVSALIAVLESDPAFLIRQKTQASLAAPAHQKILEQHPALMEKATAPIARPGQLAGQSAQRKVALPSDDEIPLELLEAQIQRNRFQALTPLFGLVAVWAFFGSFFFMRAGSAVLDELLIVALFLMLFVLGVFFVLARWEKAIKSQGRR